MQMDSPKYREKYRSSVPTVGSIHNSRSLIACCELPEDENLSAIELLKNLSLVSFKADPLSLIFYLEIQSYRSVLEIKASERCSGKVAEKSFLRTD